MFITSWYYALAAILLAGAIYKYIEYKGLVFVAVSDNVVIITYFRSSNFSKFHSTAFRQLVASSFVSPRTPFPPLQPLVVVIIFWRI